MNICILFFSPRFDSICGSVNRVAEVFSTSRDAWVKVR